MHRGRRGGANPEKGDSCRESILNNGSFFLIFNKKAVLYWSIPINIHKQEERRPSFGEELKG